MYAQQLVRVRDKQPLRQLVRSRRHDGEGVGLLAVRHSPVLMTIPKSFVGQKRCVNARQSSPNPHSISAVTWQRSRGSRSRTSMELGKRRC